MTCLCGCNTFFCSGDDRRARVIGYSQIVYPTSVHISSFQPVCTRVHRTVQTTKMADREECVYMAKLAEQAERYDEMVRWSVSRNCDSRMFASARSLSRHPCAPTAPNQPILLKRWVRRGENPAGHGAWTRTTPSPTPNFSIMPATAPCVAESRPVIV